MHVLTSRVFCLSAALCSILLCGADHTGALQLVDRIVAGSACPALFRREREEVGASMEADRLAASRTLVWGSGRKRQTQSRVLTFQEEEEERMHQEWAEAALMPPAMRAHVAACVLMSLCVAKQIVLQPAYIPSPAVLAVDSPSPRDHAAGPPTRSPKTQSPPTTDWAVANQEIAALCAVTAQFPIALEPPLPSPHLVQPCGSQRGILHKWSLKQVVWKAGVVCSTYLNVSLCHAPGGTQATMVWAVGTRCFGG